MKKREEKFNNRQLLIVFLLGVLSAMGPFTIDMYLPAFPAIAKGLNTSLDHVQLSLASFFVGISVGQLLYGPITDRYGRKKPLYFGLILYTIAAIGCAFSGDIGQLIFFRLLQALGGCAGMVVSRAVVRDLFKPQESAKVFSMLMLVMGVAPIIAPSIGSFVSLTWGWRAIFEVLAVLGVATLAFLAWLLPETKKPDPSISLNIGNMARQYRGLFKNAFFINYAWSASFASAGMFAYISSAPFIYINLFGFSEKAFSVLFSVNAAGLILCSQLNRVFLKYHSMNTLLRLSCMAMMIVGILILGSAIMGADKYVIAVLIFFYLSTLGFIYPNSTALAMAEAGPNSGTASALLGSLQMFVSFIISAAVSILFNNTIYPAVAIMALCGVIAYTLLSIGNKQMRKKKLATAEATVMTGRPEQQPGG